MGDLLRILSGPKGGRSMRSVAFAVRAGAPVSPVKPARTVSVVRLRAQSARTLDGLRKRHGAGLAENSYSRE